jgi:two-component system, NtrC family, response regulator HydG
VLVSSQAIALDEMENHLFGSGGLVEEAAGGTIYVDEAAALPDRLQQRLLGLVAPKAKRGAGSADDVRFLFGTRLDLDREVAEGRFREDFFGELVSGRIELPPLRERTGDVALLAHCFWSALRAESDHDETATELPSDFLPRFHNYRWPGNVRELSRAVRTRFCLGELGRWQTDGVSQAGEDAFVDVLDRELPLADARNVVVQEFERRYVKYMLSRHGSTREAAKAAGIAQRYLQVLIARFRE